MRIAVVGTHMTGKSSLIAELARLLPAYEVIPEPYLQLAEEGHSFHALPTAEDFELQLVRSITNLEESGPNTLFDRCPLDLLAYLQCHPESPHLNHSHSLQDIEAALNRLDLLVYLPIESPERIHCPSSADVGLRAAVDEQLRALLWDEPFAALPQLLELQGDLTSRVHQLAPLITVPTVQRKLL